MYDIVLEFNKVVLFIVYVLYVRWIDVCNCGRGWFCSCLSWYILIDVFNYSILMFVG